MRGQLAGSIRQVSEVYSWEYIVHCHHRDQIMKTIACYIRVSTEEEDQALQRREINRWIKKSGSIQRTSAGTSTSWTAS